MFLRKDFRTDDLGIPSLAAEGMSAEPTEFEQERRGMVERQIAARDVHDPRGLEAMELYYLVDDPAEERNLATSRTDQLAALTAELELLRVAAAASAVSGVTGDIDDSAKERLRALGYME